LLKDKPANVTFLGEVSEKRLGELYADCQGFIATSEKEDFGMNVLEAMSAGKAVVAVNEGGYKETLLNGKTGFLVRADVDELINAVKKISTNPARFRKACEEQAEKYSVKNFLKKMRKLVYEKNEDNEK
jgi:glycosyltransferase involved in cell wall biosynthesis